MKKPKNPYDDRRFSAATTLAWGDGFDAGYRHAIEALLKLAESPYVDGPTYRLAAEELERLAKESDDG